MRKLILILPLLLFLLLSAIAPCQAAISVTPITRQQSFVEHGLEISYPEQDVFQQYANITLRFYVMNISNYALLDISTTNCTIYLYLPDGTYILKQSLANTGDDDFYIYLNGTTYLTNLETQHYYVYCISEDSAKVFHYGYVYSHFDVTLNGKTQPGDTLIVFMILAFLAVLIAMLYTIFRFLEQFIQQEVTPKEVGIMFATYFGMFALYIFEKQYFANAFVDSLWLYFITVFALTHVIMPIIAFIITWFMQILQKKEQD